MYNGYGYGGGVTSPPLTNNPFIDNTASTSQRFPDISQPPNVAMSAQSGGWSSGGGGGQYPMQQQQMMMQQPSQFQQQQQQPPQQQWQPTGMYSTQVHQPQPTGYQMQSSYGQGVVSGSSYNYLGGTGPSMQQQQQSSAYNPVQQQLQSPGYLAQFDPYSAIGQGWGEATTTTTTITSGVAPSPLSTTGTGTSLQHFSSSHINTPAPSSTQATSISAAGDQHPRDYIRAHKALIESWDRYTWNGFLELFEKLRSAWETRKQELDVRMGVLGTQVTTLQMQTQAAGSLGYAGYLQVQQYQQEATRIQGLAKEAASNFDSVTASTFQMQEVFQNYRQSGDTASKKRVREATNAALQSLPDWPQPFI